MVDPVASNQNGTTTTFVLDPAGRRATETREGTGGATTIERHYGDESDNPAWATETDATGTTTTWYGGSAVGDLARTITDDQAAALTLTDPHGDTALTVPVVTGTDRAVTAAPAYDEYGNAVTATAPDTTEPLGCGYLGAYERATTDTGLTLIGARLYNPTAGLFTSVDPVVGGNTSAYTYPQDPVNQYEISGLFTWWIVAALTAAKWALPVVANLCRADPAIRVVCVLVAGGLVGVISLVLDHAIVVGAADLLTTAAPG